MNKRISVFVFVLSNLLLLQNLSAQEATAKKAIQNQIDKLGQPALFQGLSLSVDIATPIAYALGSNTLGSEAALRINFKNKYFPTFELGYARYDGTNDESNLHYQTSAPYLRIGGDINMLKDKTQNNRLFVGFRVGYTNYKFDVDGPDLTDPVWDTTYPYNYKGIGSNCTWLEIVGGLEAEIFRNFHMGFSLRYRSKLSEKRPAEGTPYYVPGFGTGESSGLGVTYYLVFDLSRKIKKNLPSTQP